MLKTDNKIAVSDIVKIINERVLGYNCEGLVVGTDDEGDPIVKFREEAYRSFIGQYQVDFVRNHIGEITLEQYMIRPYKTEDVEKIEKFSIGEVEELFSCKSFTGPKKSK